MSKPKVTLIGLDGNAWNIMGLCRRAAKKAGWTDDEWRKVQKEMMAGNYDNLLRVAIEHFDVS